MLIFLRRSETTNPSAVIWADGCWSGCGSWPASALQPVVLLLWGEVPGSRSHLKCHCKESTATLWTQRVPPQTMEKPASLSVHPLSQPLAATTSASQDHFSLICLPCSELLFLSSTCFAPSAVVICLHLRLLFICLIMAKISCYSANPLASLTSFCMNLGVLNALLSIFCLAPYVCPI